MKSKHDKPKAGDNIDSWCGKCKLVLAHTIEAMIGEKPARVSCNTCRSQHGYKPNAPDETSPARGKSGGNRPARGTARRHQSLVNAKAATEVKVYSTRNKYELGDVLDHVTFGRGAVTAVKDATKIEVLFESGTKTLIHAQ